MDLFSPNVHLLDFQNYETNIKQVFEDSLLGSDQLYIKHALLRNSEKVILLQTKYRSQFTDYDYFFINQISAYNSERFLKIKSLMLDKDTLVYFCVEDGGMRLYDYMQKNDLDILNRILLFKQACEIIREFKKFGELFLFFDWNIFYVIYDQLTKQPKLRAINNAGCFDIFRHFNKVLASKNEFSWLYYLYTIIFDEKYISSLNSGLSKVENDVKNSLMQTIIGGMNGLVRYSFENFMDYFDQMIKSWKPEDFNKPHVKPIEINFLSNATPFLHLLQNNDFIGALKFLQGKNIFNQFNNDCVNNKINVLFNVQNNTSIIDKSRNKINIINNIIQNPKVEAKKPVEKCKPVVNEKKLRSKTIKINNVNGDKILKIDKKIILSDSSSEESSESLFSKELYDSSGVMLNRKKGRDELSDEILKINEILDCRKRSKKEDSSDSVYEEEIKNGQSRRQSRMADHELALIKRIDNPKKKRTKAEIIEKNHLKIDLQNYEIHFEKDLINTLEDKTHGFMKQHFPVMYNIENYFLYIKNVGEKRNSKKYEIVVNFNEHKNENDKIAKLWDPTKLDSGIVDEYLNEVEKVWPRENYIWSEELALNFLMLNDYNTEQTTQKIKSDHLEFMECLEKKLLHRDYHINSIESSNMKQKRYK